MPTLERKHTILAKLEGRKGTDASPAASDAIQVIEPSYSGPTYETIENEYAAADLDTDPAEIGLGTAEMSFQTLLRGSGNQANAPETDVLFRSSGMQKADVGDLDVTQVSGTGRFALGQEVVDATTGAGAIITDPSAGSGIVRAWKVPHASATLDAGNSLTIVTGPDIADTPTVGGSEFASAGHGYQPDSEERTKHGIGSYATTAPSVGELVVYRDAGNDEVIGAGIIRAINDGTDQEVELYFLGRALATGDVVERAANTAHQTTVSGTVTMERTPSLTLYSYKDTIERHLYGGQGSWSLEAEAGKSGRISWSYQGAPGNPVDGSAPSGIVYPSTAPPRFVGGYAELNGIRFVVKKAGLDFANSIVDELDANAASGSIGAAITAREPVMTMEIKHPGIATFDLPAFLRQATTIIGGVLIGTTSGNKVAIVAPRLQVMDVSDTDFDGVSGWALQMRCRRRVGSTNAPALNDSVILDYQ